VLLSDIIMPEMLGTLMAQEILAKRPDVRVIFMSGYTSQSFINHSVLPSGVYYLEKPIATSVLLRTLRRALKDSK
jgi:YesN/AraC family two-component response regulator